MTKELSCRLFPTKEIYQVNIDLIILYYERASEFINNYLDLTSPNQTMSFSLHKSENGKIERQTAPKFNRHRMKGLYVDYRALLLNNDPSNFLATLNRLNQYFEQDEWRKVSFSLKKSWQEEEAFAVWGGYKFEDISKILFNYRFFHTALDQREKYKDLNRAFCQGAMDDVLFMGIQKRYDPIRNLRWILRDFQQTGNPIIIPKTG